MFENVAIIDLLLLLSVSSTNLTPINNMNINCKLLLLGISTILYTLNNKLYLLLYLYDNCNCKTESCVCVCKKKFN